MKKSNILLSCTLCFLLMSCSNRFAKQEYDSNEKISESEDRYTKENSVFNPIDGGYSLTVGEFNGRQTLWNKTIEENQRLEISFSLHLSNGQAKVVHIDQEGNVTTIIECTPDTSTDGFVTKTVSLKKGENRLKVVGYDCENLDLNMLLEESK